ncbi:hypothetical protein [Paenibacillus sp. WLX2291]|uniref:hypothetical protein n=1 Tax=Paenibacillus sp. WLX2291 TaxID=3296934 RepID=UPI00398422EB
MSDQLRKRLYQAEQKAKHQSEVDLSLMNREAAKAEEQGFTIIRQKRVNRTPFSQTINPNILCLNELGYLKAAELGFLFMLAPLLKIGVNAIVDPHTDQYCSVAELAFLLKRSRQKTSEMISTLIKKGIMYEFANIHELRIYGRQVSRRPFFLSPEIICCGDKNKLESGVTQLMTHHDLLEKKGIKLPIKAIVEPHATYGRLVNRKQFLQFQQQLRKQSGSK